MFTEIYLRIELTYKKLFLLRILVYLISLGISLRKTKNESVCVFMFYIIENREVKLLYMWCLG